MEKLERILHAEDEARHLVGEARSEAQSIRDAASAESVRIVARAQQEARQAAAALRDEILAEADSRVMVVETEADAEVERVRSAALPAVPGAVTAVVRELTG